jgi:hypothetical protein
MFAEPSRWIDGVMHKYVFHMARKRVFSNRRGNVKLEWMIYVKTRSCRRTSYVHIVSIGLFIGANSTDC